MRHTPVPLLGLVLATVACGGIGVEPRPADAGGKAAKSAVTCSVEFADLPAAEAVAEFVRQTGVPVEYDRRTPSGFTGPVSVFGLRCRDVSPDAAVRKLARTLGLGVTNEPMAGGYRLALGGGPEPARPDRAGVDVSSVVRTQTLPRSADAADGVEVGLRVFAGDRPTVGSPRVRLIEARDGAGKDLVPGDAGRDGTYVDSDGGPLRTAVRLRLPTTRPARLAVLRGEAVVQRPGTVLRVVADDLGGPAQQIDFNGGTLTVGPLTRGGGPPLLAVSFDRGAMSDGGWAGARTALTAMSRQGVLTGPAGEPLRTMLQQSTFLPTRLETQMAVLPARRPATRPTVIRPTATRPASRPADVLPVRMQWDVVAETSEEVIPFEFKDVVIP